MRRWPLLFVGFALSCKSQETAVSSEGDEANECRDGADNDQNGYFDCKDAGCWSSPDCEGDADTDADSDSDTDADTDSDTDVDTGAAAHLESMTLTYDFALDFVSALEGVDLDGDGKSDADDCVSNYVGDGVYVTSVDAHVTMQGTWKLASSNCAAMFQTPDLIWYDPVSMESYHTFHFDENLTYLNTWVAHKNAAQIDPQPHPANIQFYIYDMFADYDDGVRVVDHSEYYLDPETLGSKFTSTLHVEFNAP